MVLGVHLLLFLSALFYALHSGEAQPNQSNCTQTCTHNTFRPELEPLDCKPCFIPLTLTCTVDCSTSSGCELQPHWLMRVKSDYYDRHSTINDRYNEAELQEIVFDDTGSGPDELIDCESNALTTFSITITSIGDHDEVLVTCGIAYRNNSPIEEDPDWVTVRKSYMTTPMVSSKQLRQSSAIIVHEGDNATITCEKSVNQLTEGIWELSGSDLLPNEPVIVNESIGSILLNDKTKLEFGFNNSSSGELTSFQLTVLALTQELTGLTVKCGVGWDGDQKAFYEVPAVIAVRPHKSTCLGPGVMVYSDQDRNITVNNGDNVTITCKRSNGTLEEWEFTLADGTIYSYTQDKYELESKGFHFPDTKYMQDGLITFQFTKKIEDSSSNFSVRCGLKETNDSNATFNTFLDVIVVADSTSFISRAVQAVIGATSSVSFLAIVGVISSFLIFTVILLKCRNNRVMDQPHDNIIRNPNTDQSPDNDNDEGQDSEGDIGQEQNGEAEIGGGAVGGGEIGGGVVGGGEIGGGVVGGGEIGGGVVGGGDIGGSEIGDAEIHVRVNGGGEIGEAEIDEGETGGGGNGGGEISETEFGVGQMGGKEIVEGHDRSMRNIYDNETANKIIAMKLEETVH